MTNAHILIAGCGDLGCELGKQLVASGHKVTGLRRSGIALPDGMAVLQADVTRPDTLLGLTALRPDILVYSAAADAQSDESYRAHYVDGLRNVLEALQSAPLRHAFFVSSTRVYGQSGGEWLDETASAVPADFGGERLLEAEALLNRISGTALRLSGIYGPGRTRLLRLARDPQHWPVQNSWGNRIHRDDAAAFMALLIHRVLADSAIDSCYVVTDGHPTPQYEVLGWLAQRLGVDAAHPAAPPVLGGKRLGNARMLATGYALRYPDYRVGYEHLIQMAQQETERR